MIREFNEFLPGEDPRDVDCLARLMRTAMGATGTAGMGFHAISGVETVLWDIVGKASNLPVYQFLGGKYRERVGIYADCHAGKGLSILSPVLPAHARLGAEKTQSRAWGRVEEGPAGAGRAEPQVSRRAEVGFAPRITPGMPSP